MSRSDRARRSGPRPLAPLLAAILVPLACQPGPRERGGISDSAYVEAMARLYLAPRQTVETGPGLARRREEDSARAAVLAELGVAPDSLLRFAEAAGRDPARMASLWEAVAARVEAIGGPEAEGERTRIARPPDPGATSGAGEEAGEPARTEPPRPAARRPAPAGGREGAPVRAPGREARPAPDRPPGEVVRDTQELQERVRRLRREIVKDSG